jgi:tRNA(Ile)-lysidine synthase
MGPRTPPFVRPILDLPRDLTHQACREVGLAAWSDPHNSDAAYARVRVRIRVLPILESELGPGVASALARSADLLRDDADLLDSLAAEADPGTDDLGCPLLVELPRPLRRRLVRRWLARHGLTDTALAHVAMVEDLALDPRGGRRVDLPGMTVGRTGQRLQVLRSAGDDRGV